MFFRTPAILPALFPKLEWRIKTNKKEIFLTFDDGPIPGPTEFVLETLKEFAAKATFFCIGDNVAKHPKIFSQIIEDGHSVGNHTFNHLKGWNYTTEEYLTNVEACARQLKSAVISPLSTVDRCLFRPPYGRITLDQIKNLKTNYRIIMWDVLSQDYNKSISEAKCLAGTINATRHGSIAVFHDSLKAKRNLQYVLPRYLEHFSNLNYIFSAL
ncbi:MAG: polysaccharide deacetylase family protein [Flammeovirgaceae bacterium]|nr:polysaccharide deacetylase family protein [Flammeovirgaceae bacterium]